MTGEVRNLETTFNVCISFLFLRHDQRLIHDQNFFTIVKALISRANLDEPASDGHHHFEEPEQDLLSR